MKKNVYFFSIREKVPSQKTSTCCFAYSEITRVKERKNLVRILLSWWFMSLSPYQDYQGFHMVWTLLIIFQDASHPGSYPENLKVSESLLLSIIVLQGRTNCTFPEALTCWSVYWQTGRERIFSSWTAITLHFPCFAILDNLKSVTISISTTRFINAEYHFCRCIFSCSVPYNLWEAVSWICSRRYVPIYVLLLLAITRFFGHQSVMMSRSLLNVVSWAGLLMLQWLIQVNQRKYRSVVLAAKQCMVLLVRNVGHWYELG